jgi:hypothetical protein
MSSISSGKVRKVRIKTMKKKTFNIVTTMTLLLLADFGLMAIETSGNKSFLQESFLKRQFSLYGGLNAFAVNGANSDYKAGTNDFPVTPAYQAPAFGLGFVYFTSRYFAIGLDVGYGLSAKVDLRDPSDGETIRVGTPTNIVAVLNVLRYLDLSRQMRLYVSLGGGAECRLAKDKAYISALGSEIISSAPAKPLSPMAAVGAGGEYMFSAALGINLECRATYVFRSPARLLIAPALALVLKF